ncbi:MAG: hypothetical protein WCF17_03780 [Terracidiphilus sp.]
MSTTDQDAKSLNDLRKSTGRINWGEYSKLTGTPIPKNIGSGKSYKPSPAALKAQRTRKNLGRVNMSEFAAAKREPRKAVPRKRAITK